MKILKYTFIVSLLVVLCSACGKEEDKNVIPAEPVNFKVNLNSADAVLRTPGSYKEYIKGSYPILAGESLGYGGLLIINSFYATNTPDLLAYDLGCPNELAREIRVKADNNGKAKCPKCGRIYNLMENGRVVSESSNLHLQRYVVVPTSNPDVFYITR